MYFSSSPKKDLCLTLWKSGCNPLCPYRAPRQVLFSSHSEVIATRNWGRAHLGHFLFVKEGRLVGGNSVAVLQSQSHKSGRATKRKRCRLWSRVSEVPALGKRRCCNHPVLKTCLATQQVPLLPGVQSKTQPYGGEEKREGG